MNFTTLRYFMITAEELNITHAANRLFISQQALSGHITKLERELGVTLFDRTPSLSLTYAGRQLQLYAAQAVNLERQIYQTIGDIRDDRQGELRVGISHTCGRAILPSILPGFRCEHPMVNLILQETTSDEMEEAMRQGKLDIMIDFTPVELDGLQHEKLIEERLFLVVPRTMLDLNYGACREAIESECIRNLDLTLFERFPFILLRRGNRMRNVLDEYLRDIGFHPNIILETENVETAMALCEQGMGVTAYPELFRWCIPDAQAQSETVEFFPFRDPRTIGTLTIAWMKDRYQTHAAREFVAACHVSLAEIFKKQSSI